MRSLSPCLQRALLTCVRRPQSGFTLHELLIALAVSALLLLGLTTFAISSIRTTTKQAIAQRYQTGFGRLSHLIETETSEAQTITYGQPITASCGSAASLFSLSVPVIDDLVLNQTATITQASVHYYQSGTEVRRCGPAIRADGTLDTTTITDARVLSNAELSVQSDPATAANEFQYRLVMRDPRNTTAVFDSEVSPGLLTARTRVFQITS